MTISSLAFLLATAGVGGIIARLTRQPVLIGYLFVGLFLSALGLVSDKESLSSLGQIGVTLLLFLVGLEMKISDLKGVGRAALATGIGQIFFTSFFGFLVSRLLGFSTIPSLYIAVALTFSSTIIIIKLLSEKNDLESLYGKIAVGFLLVQDFVAILILMFLAGMGRGGMSPFEYFFVGMKAVALLAATVYLSKHIVPYIFEKVVAPSSELLFIVSIAWALSIASLVSGPLGFTYEVGGFLAGLALSNLGENFQIASKTRSIRDFFLTIFFVYLGTQLFVSGISAVIFPALIFSIFVLIGNPLIVLLIMGFMGHRKRTSFLAAVTVAQISEFSLILMAMGAVLGHVGESEVALVVLVGVITMTASTYLILYSEKIYKYLSGFLSIFERKHLSEPKIDSSFGLSGHVILGGGGRTGRTLARFFLKRRIPFVVVDFNPSNISDLKSKGYKTVFGDLTDMEILEHANVEKASLIILTYANLSDCLTVLSNIKSLPQRPMVVFEAASTKEAIELYKKKADYVVVPSAITGEHIREIIKHHGLSERKIKSHGTSHLKRLLLE